MRENVKGWLLLALSAVAFLAVGVSVAKSQSLKEGRDVAHKIVLCDTQAQAREILETHASEGFAAGAVTYFKWLRHRNAEDEPSCQQGIWRFTPVRRLARFAALEFGDEKVDRFLLEIVVDGSTLYAISDADVSVVETRI